MKKFIEVFKKGSKTFYFAGLFLPKDYRNKVAKLYYYCRLPDDICDSENFSKEDKEKKINSFIEDQELSLFLANNKIQQSIYLELVDGIKSDLNFSQPKNIDELINYSYKVAGTVGIMISNIFGVTDPLALTHAKNLGIAMQITNILRDINEDMDKGRVYLPVDLMEKHLVSYDHLVNREINSNLKNLIKELSLLAQEYYEDGNKGIIYLPKRVQYAIKVASKLYSEILVKIEKNDYNPFLGRVYLNVFEKASKVIYA